MLCWSAYEGRAWIHLPGLKAAKSLDNMVLLGRMIDVEVAIVDERGVACSICFFGPSRSSEKPQWRWLAAVRATFYFMGEFPLLRWG
jgi:hypothetical protein